MPTNLYSTSGCWWFESAGGVVHRTTPMTLKARKEIHITRRPFFYNLYKSTPKYMTHLLEALEVGHGRPPPSPSPTAGTGRCSGVPLWGRRARISSDDKPAPTPATHTPPHEHKHRHTHGAQKSRRPVREVEKERRGGEGVTRHAFLLSFDSPCMSLRRHNHRSISSINQIFEILNHMGTKLFAGFAGTRGPSFGIKALCSFARSTACFEALHCARELRATIKNNGKTLRGFPPLPSR